MKYKLSKDFGKSLSKLNGKELKFFNVSIGHAKCFRMADLIYMLSMPLNSIIDKSSDVILYRRDSADVELLLEHLEDVGSEECRKRRSRMDALNSKIKKGEKDDDRFLLIPRDIEYERQIIDALELESILKGHRYAYERVGVVALACIKYTGHSLYIAEGELVVAVLRASGCQYHAILRECFCEVGVVAARRHAAVTSGHNDKLADLAPLDKVDDLRS